MDINMQTAIIDEIVYLSLNKDFMKQVKILREKYGIPNKGFKNLQKWLSWRKNQKIENVACFENDLVKLSNKCKMGKTKYIKIFLDSLRIFIEQGKLSSVYPEKLPASFPHAILNSFKGEITLSFKFGPYTNLGDIQWIFDGLKEKIKHLQKNLSETRLEKSGDLRIKMKIWKLHKEKGLSPEQIIDTITDSKSKYYEEDCPNWMIDYSKVRKRLRRLETKVSNSFKDW